MLALLKFDQVIQKNISQTLYLINQSMQSFTSHYRMKNSYLKHLTKQYKSKYMNKFYKIY